MSDGTAGFDAAIDAAVATALAVREPRLSRDFEPTLATTDSASLAFGSASRAPVPAAVLVLLERGAPWHMIFTKRTTHVQTHKGEISFAGGMCDAEDAGPRETALREAHEELGIHPRIVTVLGQLDDLVTVTGFRVTPVVAAVGPPVVYQPSAAEVDRVLRVPVAHLYDSAQWFDDVRTWRGEQRILRSCRFGDDIIWGATSRILQGFLELVPAQAWPV